jgi:HK97 family phage portal protein
LWAELGQVASGVELVGVLDRQPDGGGVGVRRPRLAERAVQRLTDRAHMETITVFSYAGRVAWPFRRKQQPTGLISISDPALAAFFGVGNPNFSGVAVNEHTAVGISAVYRAVSLISGTLAGLPMRTMRQAPDGTRERVASFLDDPGAVAGYTPFEWRETVLVHLMLHGNAFLAHVRNAGGGLAGLVPIHPLAVTIDPPPRPTDDDPIAPTRTYTASLPDGRRVRFTPDTMTHIPALSVDGVRGLSPISVARNSLGIAIASDRSAAKLFSEGALMSGMVTPEEDLEPGDAEKIKNDLDNRVAGWENAATIAVVNRKLKFTSWVMSAADAQFLQSRQFQVQEIARWFGVPPALLGDPGAVSTWGTGVEIQNRGLARFTLAPWAQRVEQRLSRLLPSPRFVEFDFAGLVRPSPEEEIPLLIQQVNAGLMTPNEARRLRGMDPIPGGDVLRTGQSAGEAVTP